MNADGRRTEPGSGTGTGNESVLKLSEDEPTRRRFYKETRWYNRPKVVCLCGSLRFLAEYRRANLEETLKGNVVLTVGSQNETDEDTFKDKTPEEFAELKREFDRLHLRKIELADEVLILNKGGYMGESTRAELSHARALGKAVRFLEEPRPYALKAKVNDDNRGWVTPFLSSGRANETPNLDGPVAEVYLTTATACQFKGWHRHARKTDRFCLVAGSATIYCWRGDERLKFGFWEHEPGTVVIPPGWWHGYQDAAGLRAAYIINAPDMPYDADNPDQEEMDAGDEGAPGLEEFTSETADERPSTPRASGPRGRCTPMGGGGEA